MFELTTVFGTTGVSLGSITMSRETSDAATHRGIAVPTIALENSFMTPGAQPEELRQTRASFRKSAAAPSITCRGKGRRMIAKMGKKNKTFQ